ncbi:hypothetical protein KW791_00680 [Candidatus Parcubacteria bacterium]|nr:hypothetical protein [Candidatus Parcubacteria bacterium]
MDEQDIKNELEEARLNDSSAKEAEIKEIVEEGRSFGHPSYFKYTILFSLAAISDAVDFFEFTGIGIPIAMAVSTLCFVISLFICWVTNTKYKRAKNYVSGLEERITSIEKNTAKAARLGSRFFKIEKKLMSSPIGRILIGEGLNIIPIFSIINLNVVWVYIAYRDEKKLYSKAEEAGEEITKEVDED